MTAKRQPDQTRQQLLSAAFEEIHQNGFRSASLDAILAKTGVTKGALYHHFGSKKKLGYAVVDEIIRPEIEARMWGPLLTADDPIAAAKAMVEERLANPPPEILALGCPLNNLIQEMAGIDEGFRERLNVILDEWREAVADSVRRGQKNGHVRADVDADASAAFVICYYEGVIGMSKAAQRIDLLHSGMHGLMQYLDSLRPQSRRAVDPSEPGAAASG